MNPISPINAGGTAYNIFKFFKLFFLIIFIISVLINAIEIGLRERDSIKTIEIIGKSIYSPLSSASITALELNSSDNLWKNIGIYFSFYYNLYIIYLWLFVLYKISTYMPWSDSSQYFGNLLLSLASFFLIQVLFSSLILHENINTPFVMAWNILKSILNMFLNPPKITTYIPSVNTSSCLNGVCEI